MSQPEIVYLDLTNCRDTRDLHQRIKETFDFPDYYGQNWDAFKDAFVTVGVPEKIVICGENTVHKSMVEDLGRMHGTLDWIKAEFDKNGWLFEYEIVD